MPIYEYACDKCGHEFEVEQRISDDPVKVCPSCRGRKVKRLISRTSFVLKGSGWYSDLYSSGKDAKKADKADGDKGTDKGADKGADKPAAGDAAKDSGKPVDSGKSGKKAKKDSKAA